MHEYRPTTRIDLQMDTLTKAGCERIFTDQGVSGATIEREGLAAAIAAVGKGDVLVVWKLDRLGRSLSFLIELIEKLRNEGGGLKAFQMVSIRRPPGASSFFTSWAHWPSLSAH